MNDITTKIRGYNKRKPNTDKKFKFSNDLIERSIYVGKEKQLKKINHKSFPGLQARSY